MNTELNLDDGFKLTHYPAITSGLLAGLILAGFSAAIPWARVAIWLGALMVFHAGVGLFFRNRVNRMIEWARPVSVETRVLR
jgi:hypothetical protein